MIVAFLSAVALGVLPGCGSGGMAGGESTAGEPASAVGAAGVGGGADAASTEGMVWVPAGTFVMGTNDGHWNASPAHAVRMDGFWIDAHEVTNAQFAAFVEATGYVTVAEKPIDPADFPPHVRAHMPPGVLPASSMVFTPTDGPVRLDNEAQWWRMVEGADWRHPEGPGSSIEGRMDHPVVHVCWADAKAYADWAGKSLPTEAQWEYAARGGLSGVTYVWGDEKLPDGQWMANIWQGDFPVTNTLDDGYLTTAPVGSYPANGYGLYDMSGNVWEWCADYYSDRYYARSPDANPPGPARYEDHGPRAGEGMPMRIIRGGSFLCSDTYCLGYHPTARMYTTEDSATNHTGFRCVSDAPAPPDGE
jgi:formylglycine-generating enzyme required for sulfatase activity